MAETKMVAPRCSSADSEQDMGNQFSWRSVLGIVCMLTAATLWAGLNVASKVLYNTTNITAFEVIYFRCFVPIVFTIVYAQMKNVDVLRVPTKAGRDLFYRVVLAIFGFCLGFCSLKIMSYSKYMTLVYVYPILTQFCAYFIIGERLTVFDVVNCVSSFAGVLIVAGHYRSESRKADSHTSEPEWSFVLPLIAALFWALGDVYQRKIKGYIHHLVSPIYQYLGTCMVCGWIAFGMNMYRNSVTEYEPMTVLLLVLIGVFGLAGTAFYSFAFQLEKAGRLSALNYISVPYAVLVDHFYFHEHVDVYIIVGATLIISGSCAITVLKGCNIIR